DADVGLAARAAWWGATYNRGQTCLAVRRAFVHRDLYPAFVEALRPLVAATPPQRLALAAQVRQAEQLVREAEAAGARVLEGPPGHAVRRPRRRRLGGDAGRGGAAGADRAAGGERARRQLPAALRAGRHQPDDARRHAARPAGVGPRRDPRPPLARAVAGAAV